MVKKENVVAAANTSAENTSAENAAAPIKKKIFNKTNNFNKFNKENKNFHKDYKKANTKVNNDIEVVLDNNNQKKIDKGPKVKITFLGGVGEIGKNMTAFEFNDEIIVVDCGLSFPSDDLPGVDVVVPDITYLIQNKHKVKAFIITHGHEDHIGGIPYALTDIHVPIYGSKLTLGLIENKLKEHPKLKYKLISVKPKQVLKLGSFAVEFINVNHSIAGALALNISTPVGNIIHTGDFKIDFEPVTGETTDLIRFGELGKKGVDLLLCESTNVCKKGYSMTESNVGRVMDEIIEKNKEKRLFIATFASNIQRMQQILDLAQKHKRKVAFSGRSMLNVSEVAMKLGELTYDKNNIIEMDKINKFKPNEVLVMTTGSQGESMSALSRMANGDFKGVDIGEGDCIILSSSPIPGNEKSVYSIINKLYKKGADVIYDDLADVHTSGHACEEEIKIIHTLTKPKRFMPVHGEFRHLKRHSELAVKLGINNRDIVIPELGMQVEMTKNSIKKVGYVQSGMRLVDGSGVGDLNSSVLKDRLQLSEEGVCVAVVNLTANASGLASDPFIITRGVVYNDEAEAFNQDARAFLSQMLKQTDLKNMDSNEIKTTVKRAISSFIFKRTKRRPMILTIAMMG